MDQANIIELKEQIEALPIGYVSKKTINGNVYYYHQWSENGKKRSRYLKVEEAAELSEQIALRKKLREQLNELLGKKPRTKKKASFHTNVQIGNELKKLVKRVDGLERRDCYDKITQYLYGNDHTRVCAVYGLRRTGKTTMLFQAIADMTEEDFTKAAYVKMRTTDIMKNITDDLDALASEGYKYVFIDEVTLVEDFIDAAALLSDLYVTMGMKIVLSGTDSLGFWFAEGNELYDRVRMVHTTFIPYHEYSRLLGIDSVDEYIRYGGTLRMGETDFDNEDNYSEDASFRDDESTRKYIDTAISKNIQHSLSCYEFGRNFGHLQDLYDAGELTGCINRIIEDMNHRFVLSVLTRDFKSNDLGLAARNLRNEKDPEKRTDILDTVDIPQVTRALMKMLEIKNQDEQIIEITPSHIAQIRKYLEALDLILACPMEYAEAGIEPEERILFLQPGMRYCQAQALVHSLMKDPTFMEWDITKRTMVAERILEEVRGRMLEDIILLEARKALGKRYEVFKLRFAAGEYDMVIFDKEKLCCAAYEIKHSKEHVREQARHLMNEEMLSLTAHRYGKIEGRYVLYLGEDMDTEDGIAYRNAESFLKGLSHIELKSGLL